MTTVEEFSPSLDVLKSILWQYNDAARLQKILELKQLWYQQNHVDFWLNWQVDVFDLRTANEFGLSVWAIILDIPLSFSAPPSDINKIGFGFGPQRKNFNNGNFKRATAGGVTLTLEQKRLALQLRYFQLVTNGSVLQVNKFLAYLFGPNPDYGLTYVRDNLNMTCTYVFTYYPSSQFQLLLDEFDLLPRPAAVGFNYVVDLSLPWGFEGRANFENGTFQPFELPPLVPITLTRAYTATDEALIEWSPPVAFPMEVYRQIAGGGFDLIDTVAAGVDSYLDVNTSTLDVVDWYVRYTPDAGANYSTSNTVTFVPIVLTLNLDLPDILLEWLPISGFTIDIWKGVETEIGGGVDDYFLLTTVAASTTSYLDTAYSGGPVAYYLVYTLDGPPYTIQSNGVFYDPDEI